MTTGLKIERAPRLREEGLPVETGTFYKEAVTVATCYGFMPLSDLLSGKRAEILPLKSADARIDGVSGEFARAMKSIVEYRINESPFPTLFYHTTLTGTRSVPGRSASFGLSAVGSEQSFAEAFVLKTALSVLDEVGVRGTRVFINSVGDRDSSARYMRELGNFLRSHMEDIGVLGREALKKSPYDALEYLDTKGHEIVKDAPKSLEYLSRDSRRHFREVLEYLEDANIPYEVDDTLIGNRDCYQGTLFEIREDLVASPELGAGGVAAIARGGRYDELARKLFKAAAPAVGIVFALLQKGREKLLKPRIVGKQKIFLMYVGAAAKKQSLKAADALRKARVPFTQVLGSDQLGEQMKRAAELGCSHAVIIGQKEALEQTVLVRNIETRAQDIVPVAELAQYLKEKF